MSFIDYVAIYIIGGLTFFPLLLVTFIYLHPLKGEDDKEEESLKAGEVEEKKEKGLGAYHSGWITVMQDYMESPDEVSSSTQSVSESADNKSAYSSLYKIAQKDGSTSDTLDSSSSTLSELKPHSTGQSVEKMNTAQKKHRFFAVLKHGNLFLYKNESLKDVRHVIVLANHIVTIWPRDIPDSEIFAKRSSICILRKDWSRTRRLSESFPKEKICTSDILNAENDFCPPKGSFYIYCDQNIDKEDWYFALLQATKLEDMKGPLDPSVYAKSAHFETKNMINLIQHLYSSESHLEMKWLNAITGRLFLALQKTEVLERYLKRKLEKKLAKIKRPGFMDKFEIGKISPGESAPLFTSPHLKEVSPDGTIVVSAFVQYLGKFSAQVSTKANINLGSRFKPREVDMLLNICLEKLEGSMLLKMKPPPSARLWYSFEREPDMQLQIEPVISSRQFTYNIITNQIGKKIKEAFRDSLVLPHWDDITIYNTWDEIYRGGIWDKSERNEYDDLFSSEENDDIPLDDSEVDSKAELSNERPQGVPRTKLGSTLKDLSRKIRKSPPSSVGLSEENILSDGSMVDNVSKNDRESISGDSNVGKKSTMSTLKKLGKWYFKDDQGPRPQDNYAPPEMIVNRRGARKSNAADQTRPQISENYLAEPSYDFAKRDENSIYSGVEQSMTPKNTIGTPSPRKPPLPSRVPTTPESERIGAISQKSLTESISSENLKPFKHEAFPLKDETSSVREKMSSTELLVPFDSDIHEGAVPRSDSNLSRKPPPPGSPPDTPSSNGETRQFMEISL